MFGRQTFGNHIINPTRVSFDGSPRQKAGGVTIDLTTVPAASGTDTTLADGSIIRAGSQFLRYGQVLCAITAPATDTVTISGSPTGGTFTISVTAGGTTTTTTGIAYNATAATVQAALVALANVGTNNVTVSGSAGGPFTITFVAALGAVSVSANGASLTGGTAPAAASVSNAPGGNIGKYGPFDPNATDGRQTLTRGQCYVQDETVAFSPGGTLIPTANEIRGGVIDGGVIWQGRVIQAGVGSHSLAAGPTLSEFFAAFPGFAFAAN